MAFLSVMVSQLSGQNVPGVDVWISNPPIALARGALVTAHAVADPEAYVVVFRVTPDNHIVVLIPHTPYSTSRIPSDGLRSEGLDASFRAEQTDGVGYVFAAVSYTPFDFSHIRAGGRWETERLGVAPRRDAVDIADWFMQQIVSSRNTPYGINDVAYYIGVTPPANGQATAQQNATSQDAAQSASQNSVIYVMPGYEDPSSYYQYGYDAYTSPWNAYPYAPLYGNAFYWYDPYSAGRGSRHVKRCPDGSVVPVRVTCPVVLPSGHSREVPHRMIPRRPTPPHIMPPPPLRGSVLPESHFQTLPPAPLISPPNVGRPPAAAPHDLRPAQPRPAPTGVYNRPIVREAPPSRPQPPPAPSHATPSGQSQQH
jgi:hypothetical protein